jgi:uncharacterized membrane protein YkvA (DUF1232 family)
MADGFSHRAKQWARAIKRDVVALWIAAHDYRVPWYAKAAAGAVAAYALSPIDLIPDFVPVLGYLDDPLIVPLGIMLAIKLVPPDLMAEFRAEAATREKAGEPGGGRHHHRALAVRHRISGLAVLAYVATLKGDQTEAGRGSPHLLRVHGVDGTTLRITE